VEETALLVEVDNLHGLEDLGELTSGNVSIDVEHLTVGGLGERGKDGKASGADSRLNGGLVDTVDLADKLVLVLVKVVGVEDTGGDWAGTRAEALEGRGEPEVLLEEDALNGLVTAMDVPAEGPADRAVNSREQSGGSWRLWVISEGDWLIDN
jgi:hypothetical protein